MKKQQRWGVLLGMLLSTGAWAEEILILGIQEYSKSPILVVQEYQGLTRYLSRVLKQPVRIETVKTHAEYLKKAQAKRFTFMYGPPSMILSASKQAGYQPVAKIPGLLSAAFMSLSSSGIAFPEDMKGKRIGFTDKDSMITQLGMAHLQGMGIDPASHFKSITYFRDVDGVLAAMKLNLIDIGVANSGLFNAWTNKGNDINMVMQGKGMPHLTFAVRGDLSEGFREAVTHALLKASQDSEAHEYFRYSSFPGFEPAKPQDYAELEKLLHL
ncbi:MAG: phosphate/phosphite/phosphonate ABC transporter substrate-binding protein [Sulfuricella denitrificans]|nr:phosphate/phosphite/phosphonate ABC transporter substrate-binding protein [Sulfuricella denitrificans]